MRKNAKNWIVKIILISIALVFVFWGVGNFKPETLYKVASVNGENILFAEYSRLYHDLVQEYGGEQNNLDLFTNNAQDHLKSFALEQIINRKLIIQQAIESGLCVTDKELASHIQNDQLFSHNGVFDIFKYKRIVSNLGFTPIEFEKYSRESLLIKKFIDIIYGMINVSEAEITDWYEWYYSPIKLSYVFFNPNDYIVDANKEKIYDYFEQNKYKYKYKLKHKLRYVIFHPDNYLNDINILESEILEYYDSHRSDFTNEKKVNVSHILVKVNSDFDSEEQKKDHIENIFQMINEGTSFSELAGLYSECPSKVKGGLIGDITYNSVVQPFAGKAFSMTIGEISSPIRTQFGWHIIKVNSIKESNVTSLSKSEKEIRNILSKSKTDMIAYNSAATFLEKCYGENDLVNNANLYNTSLIETDWFDDNGPIEISKNDFSVIKPIISSMRLGEISDVCKLDDCYVIIQVIGEKKPVTPNFEDIATNVASDFKVSQQNFMANSNAEAFLANVKSTTSFEDTAKIYKVNPGFTCFFTRNDPSSSKNSVLFKKSFEMFKVGDLVSEPIKTDEGFYVACITEKRKPKPIDCISKQEKNSIINTIIENKQSKLLSEIITSLRKTSKIEINEHLQSN